jgi:hypothetical protein
MNELHFGLCVGIDRYPGFPGRDLSSASGDARSFRDWLVAPAGGALPAGNARPFRRGCSVHPDVDRLPSRSNDRGKRRTNPRGSRLSSAR